MESPFETYRDMVLGHYSTAAWLRTFVMSMWNGTAFKVGMSQVAMLDDNHFEAFHSMLMHYRRHGERDPAFMKLADDIRARMDEEEEEARRAQQCEEWRQEVALELRQCGKRRGLLDDRYEWFTAQFEAGVSPEAAAREAKELDEA